jgi:DNA-binding beta-propeller fold protein YncE
MTTNLFSIKLEGVYRAKDSSEEELSPPSGLCFSSEGKLLLADDFNHRIQVYDSQFNLLHSFGSKGKEPGQFQYPKGIAVDPEGNIYVADSWNHQIQKFDSEGTFLFAFGTCGDEKGELNEPYDILVETSGNLIVVERYNHRIQIFDPQGESLGWVGDRGTVYEEQLAELLETPNNILSPPLFELPTSIAKDSRGNYFITDSGNHRVRKFNPQWQEILSFGEMGTEEGQFQYPQCVTVATNDLLYVADLNNERVQVFSPFGQYLFAIGGATNSDQVFEAPCLTAIDLKGCLYIGFTFNTQISKYLVPLVSQNTLVESLGAHPDPDPAHCFYQSLSLEEENDNSKALTAIEKALALLSEKALENTLPDMHLRMKASLQFSCLSAKGTAITNKSLELACHQAEEQLEEIRNNTLKSFLAWQESASKFTEHLLEEQRKISQDPEGIRDFNRDLHIAEQEDKNFYRLSQNEFHFHRKAVQQFSQVIHNFIQSGLPKDQLKAVRGALLRQTEQTLDLMKEYFGQKEKSEESMIRILGESQGERDKLSAFLTQYHPNGRIMNLQQYLQFELRSHWFNLRTLARSTQMEVSLENFAGKATADPAAFENIMRILIGFHEAWSTFSNLEQQSLDSLDTLLRLPTSGETTHRIDLTLADFTPISFDSESLDFVEVLKILEAEGSLLNRKKESLVWGKSEFQFPDFSKHTEQLAHCAFKLLETQATYQEKFKEITLQLEELSQQRKDLDIQLKQVPVEDKISPIALNDNISILQFQINLVRRMIMSLDINRLLNLNRLVLASAFLSMADNEFPEAQRFFQAFDADLAKQDHQIRGISKSRKEKIYRIVDLEGQAGKLGSKYEISEISDSIRIEEEIAQATMDRDQLEFEYHWKSRIKNILDKLADFRDSQSGNSRKTSFQETQTLERDYTEISQIQTPQGICHNRDGELLVVDFGNHQIYNYSPQGNYQFRFGGWGTIPGKLQYPNNLTIDSKGCIYVIESKANLIKKFNKEGKYLFQFGLDQSGMLFSPSIDSQDNIWIADPEQNRIGVFDEQGNILRILQGDDLNLKEPVSIYCLPKGEHLVGDRSESLLKHFDAQDNLVKEVGKTGLGVDDIYFLAWHPDHGIFGSDFWNSQIVHLNNQLEIQTVYHKPGRRAGQLGKVGGLSIFNDQLAVANFEGGKVQIFDLTS